MIGSSTYDRRLKEILVAALVVALAACASPRSPPASAATLPQPVSWKALLIAGDDKEPAFANAVDAMTERLVSFGVAPTDIMTLKASGRGAQAATAANVRRDFALLDPATGEGCFVFITSHGARDEGLVIRSANAFLSPNDLGSFLDHSCGTKPTVVIASGCFSGVFAQGQSAPAANRIIVTAARADRPSFGCSANRKLTIFDQCVLDSLDRGLLWQDVMQHIRACVATNEQTLAVAPSSPQISIGSSVANLRVF